MTEAKIEVKIGQIQFSSQGDQDWVAKQLDKILSQAEKLIQLAPEAQEEQPDVSGRKPTGKDSGIAKMTLPAFLSERGAAKNQIKKFLATAVWLDAKGQKRIQTRDVTRALKDSNQSRLANPADCLKKNVGKGHCEKDGKQFYVTEEGKNLYKPW